MDNFDNDNTSFTSAFADKVALFKKKLQNEGLSDNVVNTIEEFIEFLIASQVAIVKSKIQSANTPPRPPRDSKRTYRFDSRPPRNRDEFPRDGGGFPRERSEFSRNRGESSRNRGEFPRNRGEFPAKRRFDNRKSNNNNSSAPRIGYRFSEILKDNENNE